VVTTYREHVHALTWGVSPEAVMAELFGRSGGCSGGYGGSMHLFDAERRFLGGYAIVGETFPVAIGAAYRAAMYGDSDVVLCYFGDGAVNQGTFHESLNMAALWQLPVLFICENNHYQIGTEVHRHSAVAEVAQRGRGNRVEGRRVDGMDVAAVHDATRDALRHVREGYGPLLLECDTYRFRGHSMADPAAYRSALEERELRARDPLLTFRRRAAEQGWVGETEAEALEGQAREAVEAAVAFAADSPPPTDLLADIYTQPVDPYRGRP
jgi:pyruvate dehydrogenase E1 component alpha subunit